ncbi:MAG: ParB/RepB/Spo0J family partition protein [Bryobacteraceae bacterium]|nr:ParB/RepB/Spo0J family partition protein [Bryobacteraceae bacterium]
METVQNNSVLKSAYRDLPLTQLRESPTNPRRRYDEAALKDLAASIEAQGVLAPLLVREIEPERFEVVVGSRRFRAARIAGKESVPVRIVPLTDAEAVCCQAIENLQREGVHPLEEAKAFQLLVEQHFDLATIAAKIGKSEKFVAERLRLVELNPPIADAFLDDKLTIGHALMIAKLPQAQQPEAFTAAFRSVWTTSNGQTPILVPAKELAAWIESNILMELNAAPFDRTDATLSPDAGSCHDCPKRTGANSLLFPEATSDQCLDRECFHAKVAAHIARSLERNPKLIQISTSWGTRNGGPLSRNHYTEIIAAKPGKKPKSPTPAQKKCPHMSQGLVVDGANRGQILTVCAEPTCTVHHAEALESKAARDKVWADQRREDAMRKVELTARKQILSAVLDKVVVPLKKADLETIATAFLQHLPSEYRTALSQRHKLETGKPSTDAAPLLEVKLRGLDEIGLCRLLVEISLLESVSNGYSRGERLEATVKRYRIGAEKIRESVRTEFEAKRKKQEERRNGSSKVKAKAEPRGKCTAA